jgi:hypothetical protein
MAARQEYFIGVKIGGTVHRLWGSYANESLSAAKAIAKLDGVQGVVLQGFNDKQPRFKSGDDLSDHL